MLLQIEQYTLKNQTSSLIPKILLKLRWDHLHRGRQMQLEYVKIAFFDQPRNLRLRRLIADLYPCATTLHVDDGRWRSLMQSIVEVWSLFHGLLLRCYLPLCYNRHNLTPEKRDNSYSPHPLTPTSCLSNNIQLITGISPCCRCL